MSFPFIRPYEADNQRDFNNGLHIFFTTIDSSVDFEPARTIGSYLWYKAYVSLSPSTCFILDDGTGRAVGYIVGTADTAIFASRWKEAFTPIVDPKLVPRPGVKTDNTLMDREDVQGLRKAVHGGECSMLQSSPLLLDKYAAHFHIDILPEYQKKGWGRQLLDTFLETARGAGAQGVHLGMIESNAGARRFYERHGFQLCGAVLDGGETGLSGRQGPAICLVKAL